MEHSRTLVTGATGFIGRCLVDRLLADDKPVRVLTRGDKALPKSWAAEVECHTGDLRQVASLSGVADGIDTVYHLAGEFRDARLLDAVNRSGTESLLEICGVAGVRRFVYLSSVGVIGAGSSEGRVDEGTLARPSNAYEVSKYAGEQAALRAHQSDGMQVSVVRPSIVFGEGKPPSSDSFLSWMRAVQAGRAVSLGESYVSSYVYVGDVVAACLTVAGHPVAGGQIYIVNEPVHLSAFVGEMARLLGVRGPFLLPRPLGPLLAMLLRLSGRFGSLYNHTVYSMDKLSGLGFTPPYGYRNGLRRTIEWYEDNGLLRTPSGRAPTIREHDRC